MKFLFYLAKLYSIPVVMPLVEYINQYTNDEIAFFVSEKVFTQMKEENRFFNVNLIKEIKQAINYQPDYCITPGNYIDYRLPGIKVQIFHGVGIEKASHYEIRHFFDVYLTSGPIVTEKFIELQKKYKYFLVYETGWLKFDHIIKYNTKNLNELYNIPANKKIILYAPTFSNKLQSAECLLPSIPGIIKDDEFWLLKLHELKKNKYLPLIEKLNKDNFKIINDYDITPLLHLANVMISDTSSVIYEFMALDKPVITFNTSDRKDKGINITEISELRPALDQCINFPEEMSSIRKKHLKEVNPYLNGEISKNIYSTLIKIKKNNELLNKKKPLNLLRKIKIHYHELIKKGYLK
ncbi:MAG: CDP-glycerol glycerophosphotransferase family protein [Candidatus Cloacimonetes bacterium]|nr:CDP-glycerol glycerophosphotransferase family protein [Candidatus Cloacimonadota bacterium]MDD4156002.1 CDP-glycerol glycerophosphotransferase family protein [Candidatus Cloacimonadota bacterium]